MPFSPAMTDEERLARIGALLRKAAVRYWAAIDAGEIPPPPEMAESVGEAPPVVDDGDRVLRYIERHGAAAPKDIRLALGLAKLIGIAMSVMNVVRKFRRKRNSTMVTMIAPSRMASLRLPMA